MAYIDDVLGDKSIIKTLFKKNPLQLSKKYVWYVAFLYFKISE